MILSQPLGLWLLALLPVVVLAHLLFQRRRALQVSSLLIWKRLEASVRRRLWLRRVFNRHLLLQVLAVVLAALALSQPALPTAAPPPAEQRALIVDASASMGAKGGAPMEQARRRAGELIRASAPETEISLIAMGARPRLIGSFLPGDPRLRDAVETLSPRDEDTDPGAALRLAETLTGGAEGRTVDIITDAAFTAPGLVFDPDRHVLHRLQAAGAAAAGNAGITAFRLRLSPDGSRYQLFARVSNYGLRPLEGRLRLLSGETLLGERPVAADAGGRASLNLELPAELTGPLVLELVTAPGFADALPADNRAYAVPSRSGEIEVALISQGNHFLSSALVVNPEVSVTVYPSYRPGISADVLVLDRQEEVPVAEGRVLAMNSTVAGLAVRPAGLLEEVADLAWSENHPVTAGIDLSGTFLRVARPYITGPGVTPLLQQGPQVLGYALDTPRLRVVGFGFDLERSNIPLQPGFPILIRRALEWLDGGTRAGTGRQVAAGETVDLETVPGAPLMVRDPRGQEFRFDGETLSVPFRETGHAGIYRVRRGPEESLFAVNLLSEEESNLLPRFTAPAEPESAGVTSGSAPGRELWRLVLILAALLILGDGLLWSRRT